MKKDFSEMELFYNQVKSYFVGLGYPEQNAELEVKTSMGRVDFLIRDSNFNPHIIVEIKLNFEEGTIQFDSSIWQAHKYATALQAPYFVVFNGIGFYWYKTGPTGRPEIIEPISFTENLDQSNIQKNKFALSAIRNLRNITNHPHASSSKPTPTESAIFILIKLYAEREFDGEIDEDIISTIMDKFPAFLSFEVSVDGIWKVADILRDIKLNEIPKSQLVQIVEQSFLKEKYFAGEFDLPNWLSVMMAKLAQIDRHDSILNLNSGLGNILTALIIEAQNLTGITITGQINQDSLALWIYLRTYIYTNTFPDILNQDLFSNINSANKVICAPRFGGKLNKERQIFETALFSQIKSRNSESLQLMKSIEATNSGGLIIFLAPQGMLFRNTDKKLRQIILDQFKLKAVIGLPNNSLAPYASVKTSLLVIEKNPPNASDQIFMAELEEIPKDNDLTLPDDSKIQIIINSYFEWIAREEKQTSYKYISHEEIINSDHDFTAARYTKNKIILSEQFEIVPLKDISISIKRGKNFRTSEPGETRVLTSAVIRSMQINSDEIKRIDNAQIPENVVRIEGGDIIVNAVGTYMGNAALASEDYSGLPINHHVIVIKPDKNLINPEYLALAFNSKYVQTNFHRSGVIPNLNLPQVRSVMIPIPSISMQNELVSSSKKLLSEMEQSVQRVEELKEEFNTLVSNLRLGGNG